MSEKMKKKKLMSILLALTMIFGLVACKTVDQVDDSSDVLVDESTENSNDAAVSDTLDDSNEPESIQFPLEEPYTFSMFSVVNEGVELGDCRAFQEL